MKIGEARRAEIRLITGSRSQAYLGDTWKTTTMKRSEKIMYFSFRFYLS